ncbi:nitrous oxide reductase accessory protein NosL [Flavihumibacter profundi]|uniref:nitrous oxide reductase accessory protein NosL n=1 Tax=Flavihumibacter profundi TaxID=2716883 RepID=UPI001CC6BEAE|nr:nitrous oxide reductase accessory protein NosL [Flavihumibacter profundi]MBZ5857106.1 nitrous oxide reductase accessory protein NosL [Flavihumibacter profundi]
MHKRLHTATRVICIVCAIGIAAVIFLPIWRIELSAPQYPEGLVMQIFASKLGGNVEVINGLNHYIGMSQIHEKDFVEFQVLPVIFVTLAVFGLLTAIINRKWFFYAWFIFFALFGIVAMMDFYRWEYNYGHNLNPTAPIVVPGMAYQPPLIGYKQLLNFGAYSIPDSGGWIFIGAAVLLLFCFWLEIRKIIKIGKTIPVVVMVLLFSNGLISCSTGPTEIPYGKVPCDYCKMTILDKKFGAELVTAKGKMMYFDDLHCLISYKKENHLTDKDIAGIYISDYAGSGQLVRAGEAFYASGESIHGPMGGNIAAFLHADDRNKYLGEQKAVATDWKTIAQP